MTRRIVYIAFFIVLYIVVFQHFFFNDAVLLTTDAAVRGSNVTLGEVVNRMAPHWNDSRLLGTPLGSGLALPSLLKGFMPSIVWNNHIYGIAILLSCAVLTYFFRSKGIGWETAGLASVVAFWLGSNFTLLYAGHDLKPYVVLFFVLALSVTAAAAAGSVMHAVIWGSFVGMMFIQQADVALFFALFAGAYLAYCLWCQHRLNPKAWLKVLVPSAVIAFLFAAEPLFSGYEHHVKGTAQMESGDKNAKWDYVTQWSIPPNEVVDFVAPGYYGWRSGESEGPYWGRTGQSAEWEKTGQGFRNFKLESTYIGMIPFAFAFFALFAFRRSEHKAEILFWAGAALIALLLSFGKYFPLYALFYKLPVVNSIRNPNKFIQVFQVCLAILSAYGMDAMWRSRDEDRSETGTRRPLFIFFMSSVAVTLIFCLWALIDMLAMKHGVAALIAGGWQATAAKSIAQTRVAALGHAALMAFISTGITALFCFRLFEKAKSFGAVTAAVILLIVAGDAVQLSKKYIKKMPRSYIASNALTDFLDKNLSGRRVAFLSQQGIDNIWITYLMPYNRIPCFNFTDMPRIANDYKAFLEIGQRNPLNMWRLSSVKYLLGPATLEEQLSEAGCRKVFAYGLSDAGQGEFKVVPHANGPFAVYELQGSLPRYALFAGSRKFPEAQLLPATLSNLNEVCLPEASSLPVLSGSGATGSIEVLSSRAGKVRLKVNANAPAILRASEKYDPDWTASLDGENVAVEPVDFLFQGIFIPTGEHEVVLRYAPSRFYFCLQCIGMLLMVGAVVWVVVRRKGVHVAD